LKVGVSVWDLGCCSIVQNGWEQQEVLKEEIHRILGCKQLMLPIEDLMGASRSFSHEQPRHFLDIESSGMASSYS
jgi:hypothetical protein